MVPQDVERASPLPHGGIDILTTLITHQDTTTWAGLSVFLAAEFALLVIVTNVPGVTPRTLALFGLIVTGSSYVVLKRSNDYLDYYYDLARKRCSPSDLEIFDAKMGPLRAYYVIFAFHVTFAVLWSGVFYVNAI